MRLQCKTFKFCTYRPGPRLIDGRAYISRLASSLRRSAQRGKCCILPISRHFLPVISPISTFLVLSCFSYNFLLFLETFCFPLFLDTFLFSPVSRDFCFLRFLETFHFFLFLDTFFFSCSRHFSFLSCF